MARIESRNYFIHCGNYLSGDGSFDDDLGEIYPAAEEIAGRFERHECGLSILSVGGEDADHGEVRPT
jgi:hypothetical protein